MRNEEGERHPKIINMLLKCGQTQKVHLDTFHKAHLSGYGVYGIPDRYPCACKNCGGKYGEVIDIFFDKPGHS
jgi:hypothetical protein